MPYKSVEQRRENNRRYYLAHREEFIARAVRRQQVQRDEVREYHRKYYREYRKRRPALASEVAKRWRASAKGRAWMDTYRAQARLNWHNWRVANRDRLLEKSKAEGKARRKAPGRATPSQIRARIEFYGWKCWMCHEPFECMDHVIPIVAGGSNWPANLRPACRPCNSRKATADKARLQRS